MASTIQRDIAERLSRQSRWPPRPPRSGPEASSWLRPRSLSWGGLLRRLPLYAGLVVAVGVFVLVLVAAGPRLLGYHTFIVYGGSMAPTLRPGDVALTKPVAVEAVQVGDIIAARPNPETVPLLHRVTAIEEEGGQRQFIIKGDRNEDADPSPVLLVGSGERVVQRVPFAGYVIHFVRTLPGRLLFLVLPTVLLGGMILWEIWRPRLTAEAPAALADSEGPVPEAGPAPLPAPTLGARTWARKRLSTGRGDSEEESDDQRGAAA